MENNIENQEVISKKLLALNGALLIAVVIMSSVIYSKVEQSPVKQEAQVINFVIEKDNPFDKVNITGASAYVFDVAEDKVLFKKNEFSSLPLASITKLMTVLLATEIFPETENITIKKEFLSEEGDTGLLANEVWKLKDLIDFSLVVSSNDGVRSIASFVGAYDLKSEGYTNDYDRGRKNFILKMNSKAKEIGLQQTYFTNESGLDRGGLSGGYGSAIDVAKLVQYILKNHPNILEATKYQSITVSSLNKSHKIKNTNSEVNNIPGIIASKTGFTDMAGGNLVVAFDSSIGRPIIVVVLGSTQEGRFEDVKTLVDASLEYIGI